MAQSALVLGGTGLIGTHLIKYLTGSDHWSDIAVLTRRPLNVKYDGVTEIIGDATNVSRVLADCKPDVVFCCLGTTRKKAGSRKRFREIDHDYVVKCAEILKRQGAQRFLFVSALGAKVGSLSYYSHVKGETERDLSAIGFEALDILRPSLLLGERHEARFAEDIAGTIMPFFSGLLVGSARKYRPIEAIQVAKAMSEIACSDKLGVTVYESDKLARF
ncbi:NAD-dependent epimerase/dehydratase family protein [Kordiimonas sp. SCSIO 12610]|uniref:NAD-dependent epimerase/dehydratase family protein n=1 Tax=Kordiimonas sp. SCSIO 12610 TaxID=2829597 RepID=UPI00210EBA77|nr:NAD-dependent epimerase/dehydratase family protein [Kordiimonas sp. SCSIO 12610]UTW56491.1 NAD-dependent epimerase/dehydratase family protein [Kordiimonas sp. SCSIO 12610]